MAGRLKRRSSILVPPRRDSIGGPTTESDVPQTPVQPFTQTTEDEEAAERRARNLQRKQQQMEVSDTPSLERQNSASRRSVGGISGLSAAQLAEHYQNCLKLSAENKISSKNAFNLQLIDYMSTMIKNKESEMNNFQIAAGTLDASSKIYAFRVDSVYDSTLKIASGLGQAGKQEAEEASRVEEGGEADEEGVNPETGAPAKRKRIKKSSTVEKNMKNINLSKLELEFDVDPLFKKTTSQFDGASGGNQFLATLRLRGECGQMLLDSDTVVDAPPVTPAKGSQAKEATSFFPVLDPALEGYKICPTFGSFSFAKWSLEGEVADEEYNRLNESISASQEEREACQAEDAFDVLAVPEPLEDEPGGVDFDLVDDPGGPEDQSTVWSERAEGHAGRGVPGFTAALAMTPTDMLSVLTTAPLEYSYFDHGKLGAWAGPKHWKLKPLSRMVAEAGETGGKGGRKKKQLEQINYENYDDMEDETVSRLKQLLTTPKKSVKLIDKTMKGWNRERSTLPEDWHYSGHELVRLKTVDRMVVVSVKKTPEQEVDDVEDYDYDNPGDNDGYCPDIDDEADAYGEPSVGQEQVEEMGNNTEGGLDGDQAGGEELDLVQAPKLVDKAALQIGYAKTAKKVDMKKIKSISWRILTQASSEDKENISETEKSVLDKKDVEKVDVEEMPFSRLYRTLKQPNKLPKMVSESLSVPLAFIALLHLCNEETLKLIPSENLEDFQILKG